MSHNAVEPRNGIAVAASQTDSVVSRNITPQNPFQFQAMVVLSAVAQTNGISFRLRDSYDGGVTYSDVGSRAIANVNKKTFAGGTAEISTITVPATASAAQGDYFVFSNQAGTSWAVWLDIDADGTAPTGAAFVAVAVGRRIKAGIATGDTATQAAAKVVAAIAASFVATTVLDNLDGTVKFTQTVTGACTDPARHNTGDTGNGSFTISVGTQGSNGGVATGTGQLTSTTHGFVTGDQVIYNQGTSVVGGLTNGSTYFVIRVDADTLQLATTQARSLAGTAITLTTNGSGTQALYSAVYEIRLTGLDSSDLADLPLWDTTVVVCTTGASDTCTVSGVYVNDLV